MFAKVLAVLMLIVVAHARDIPTDAPKQPQTVDPSYDSCVLTKKYFDNMHGRLRRLAYFGSNKSLYCQRADALFDKEAKTCYSECTVNVWKKGHSVSFMMKGTITPGDDTYYLFALYSDLCEDVRNC
jgi:hypothetical protein